ncbi:hypothetical protein [Salibacterium sp. K-3]
MFTKMKHTLIGTAVLLTAAAGGSPAAAETGTESFSMNHIIQNYYADTEYTASEETETLNIGLNTLEGSKGFDDERASLTYTVEEMFDVEDPSYINDASGELVLSVSNPETASLDEGEKTAEKTITPEGPAAAHEISVFAESEGAAKIYLNEKNKDTMTTLGTVEVEVK